MSTSPIVLVGTGRCGSTIAYSLLAAHPQLAWISSWVDAFPSLPFLAAGNRFLSIPGMDFVRQTRFMPRPVEPNSVFSHVLTDYYSEHLDEGVLKEARARLLPLLESIGRFHGKPRLLIKMVGRPVKTDLLTRLFEKPFFIHVTRELKATVASLMQIDFYNDLGTIDHWSWDTIPQVYLDYYESHGRPDEIAAAIMVVLNRAAIERQLSNIEPTQWVELRYADLVAAPIDCLRRIGTEAELPIDDKFLRHLRAYRLYGGADEKWKRYFNDKQAGRLDEFQSLSVA